VFLVRIPTKQQTSRAEPITQKPYSWRTMMAAQLRSAQSKKLRRWQL
jgi:hypothetical protein